MPLYEYKCKKCDVSFEILQRNKEKAVCPTCGSSSLEKLFSVFAKGASVASASSSAPASAPGSCGTGCCGMKG